MIGDVVRPSEDELSRVLHESFKKWHSYLSAGSKEPLLPRQALNMKSPVSQTPSFLGDGWAPWMRLSRSLARRRNQPRGKTVWSLMAGLRGRLPKNL